MISALALLAIAAPGAPVIVWGHGPTKALAIQDALREAVLVTGVRVQTRFSATQSIMQSKLTTDVNDLVRTRADGFVAKHELLTVLREETGMAVKVRAWVYASRLEAELQSRRALLPRANSAWLRIAIEQGEGLEEALTAAMIDRGFTVVGHDGAAIDITGLLVTTTPAPPTVPMELELLNRQTRIEATAQLRAVQRHDGRIIGAKTVQMSSIGLNRARAIQRLFFGRGRNLVDKLSDTLTDMLTGHVAAAIDAIEVAPDADLGNGGDAPCTSSSSVGAKSAASSPEF